jgi:glyoxylase-like metal-dependent hydrolase (beta-lactamase superfamily II)
MASGAFATSLPAQRLRLIQFTSDSAAGYVTSTAIVGPTEAVLVDAQYFRSDARRDADSVAKLGRRVKAIIITHPHEDHYFGGSAFVERLPGTPVYMTARSVEVFRRTSQRFLDDLRKRLPAEVPDSFPTPTPLSAMMMTVDGEPIEIVPDLQGDVYTTTNSFVWIPSLRAVIAGDIVFNQVHAWLGSSDSTTRARWRESLSRIADLHPAIVVAGHTKPGASDGPAVLDTMRAYLDEFDAALAVPTDAKKLVGRMSATFPTYVGPDLLSGSAESVLRARGK